MTEAHACQLWWDSLTDADKTQSAATMAWIGWCARASQPPAGEVAKDAGWRDIESAPKPVDQFGAWLLVRGYTRRTNANAMVVRWDGQDWESSDDGYGAYIAPTHWMPLPAPPSAANEGMT